MSRSLALAVGLCGVGLRKRRWVGGFCVVAVTKTYSSGWFLRYIMDIYKVLIIFGGRGHVGYVD
jgi:hypothetical protein